MREKCLLMVVLIGLVFFIGCAGEEPSKGEGGTPEATMTETPEGTTTERPTATPITSEEVKLEYTVKSAENPDEIPDELQKWRKDGYKWVIVELEVNEGNLDMEDIWFRSRVETSERFYDLDHTTDKLKDGIQSRGSIKAGGKGVALYQIPVDEETYSWNLEKTHMDIEAMLTENPTVTATPESKFDKNELAERIDEEINEEYINYLDNIYMNYKEDMLFISYISYMGGDDVEVYAQSLSVMEIINAYIVERDLEIKTIKFRITSEIRSLTEDDGKIVEYSLTIERTGMQKFLNGTWGFSEWKEMTNITGEE